MIYRDFFAILCFISFGIALYTQSAYAYWAAAICGVMSRTAYIRGWQAPEWIARLIWFRPYKDDDK